MAILTLTTDWGLRDHYLASFKGEILTMTSSLQLVDISHEVEKFNIMQAAFILRNTYKKFPAGTIHFIGVSKIDNHITDKPYVIVKTNGQFLVGEDSGIFSLILDKDDKEIIRLPFQTKTDRKELLNNFVTVINKLSGGGDLTDLGKAEDTLEDSYFATPTVDHLTIRGAIIYIDSFGNAVVNIERELFFKEKKDRSFTIFFRKSSYNVSTISNSYEEVEVGEMLALFNQDGFLEISLNKGSAAQLLGLKIMEPIRIEFHDYSAG
jgi:S-adenosyl-L-methionine hydrolase (adenosine-forming)